MKTIFINKIKEDKMYLLVFLFHAILFLFFCSKMSPLYPSNEWADVSVYHNIGKAMLAGRTLYSEVFDPKGPLIFFIYSLGALLSKSTFIGLYIILVLGWTIAMYAIFSIAKRFLSSTILSITVAMLTPLFSLNHMHSGGSAEEFILISLFVSLFVFVKFYAEKGKINYNSLGIFALGIATSAIFFLKLNLTVFCILPLLGMFTLILIKDGIKPFFKSLFFYFCGALVIAFPICLYLFINNSLQEAFNTYILLNKHLAIKISLDVLIKDGFERIYHMLREFYIGTLLVFVGGFYFPLKFIKNTFGKIIFILSAIGLFGMIFFAGVFHFYYPLPLYMFVPLGLIPTFILFEKYLSILFTRKSVIIISVIIILSGISTTRLFDVRITALTRILPSQGVSYEFADIIKQKENPTILNLAYGDSNHIYTLLNLTPTVKYFTSLNIPYYKYPILRDEQVRYIEDKEVDFVILDNISPSEDVMPFFQSLPSFQQNYELVSTYIGHQEYQHLRLDCTAYLYKRID